jgi:hypothetical protein
MHFLNRRTALSAALAGLMSAGATGVAKAQPTEASPGSRNIDLNSLAAPIRREQVLTGYMFLTVRTVVADGVDLWTVRERNHFLRDAFVRVCYRNRLIEAAQPTVLVEPLATNAFRAAAIEVLGARAVGSVAITQYQVLGMREPIRR